MTVDYIAYHALTRPEAIAVIDNDHRVTYSDFHRDVRRFMKALPELGVRPGGVVAVGCKDFYTHWLLLLAFEHLGIATASLAPSENESSTAPLLAAVDLVLSDTEIPAAMSLGRYRPITPDWLARVRTLEPAAEQPRATRSPGDVVRILRSSGTTGTQKRMLLRRRVHEARLGNWTCFGMARGDRYLVSMPFTMHAVYSTATAYIRAGATVVHESRRTADQALVAFDIDHVTLMPAQLRQVLDRWPDGGARPRKLVISSLGATLPAALRTRARSRVAADVLDLYACNETALVAVTYPETGSHGVLWPGVEVEIVDERGERLPQGQAGPIRIATEAMVEGYIDDPETTARMFRDGWFYPGDVGVLHGGRRLQVLGRADELLNVGGAKMSPAVLEEDIMTGAAIDDVGVCTVADAEGVEQLCVAVTRAVAEDKRALERISRLKRAFPPGKVLVVGVGEIPRTTSGKIQRGLLKSVVLDALRAAGAM